MSYDILIIDPTTVPTTTHQEFMDWYNKATQWDQPRNYSTSTGSTPAITNCYTQLAAHFPDINSDIDLDDDEAEEPTTEYTIGDDFLYTAFDWDDAEEGHNTAHTIATQLGLAFVDVSDTTTIHFPDGSTLTH